MFNDKARADARAQPMQLLSGQFALIVVFGLISLKSTILLMVVLLMLLSYAIVTGKIQSNQRGGLYAIQSKS